MNVPEPMTDEQALQWLVDNVGYVGQEEYAGEPAYDLDPDDEDEYEDEGDEGGAITMVPALTELRDSLTALVGTIEP